MPKDDKNNGNKQTQSDEDAIVQALNLKPDNSTSKPVPKEQPKKNVSDEDAIVSALNLKKKDGTTDSGNGANPPNPTPTTSSAISTSPESSVNTDNTFEKSGIDYAAAHPPPTPQEVALKNAQDFQKTQDDLKGSIGAYSKKYGLNLNPDEVLSSADKTSQFLQQIKGLTAKEARSHKLNLQRDLSGLDKEGLAEALKSQDISRGNLQDPSSLINQLTNYSSLLQNHIVTQTIKEDKQNGVTKDKSISKIAQRLDPTGYANAAAASIPKPNVNPALNIPQAIGDLYDMAMGTKDKDDLLNSVKGVAEIKYNDGQEQLANNKISQGILTNNQQMIEEGQADLKSVDTEAIYKYPSLLKQKLAQDVSRTLAREQGELVGTSTENLGEKIFGGSVADYARIMKDKGYLDDPKTRDVAINLLQHPELFTDNSYIGGAGESFISPSKNLGLSIGDITGIRNEKDIYTDKLKDEMFPKEQEGAKPNDFTVLGLPVNVRKVVNTTANLAGMAVIAGATEGVGTEAGLAAKSAERLGAYTSFGLPSYDENLKDSYNFIDNPTARNAYAVMGAILNSEGGKFLDLGKISRVPVLGKTFSKLATGLTEKTLTEDATKELLDKGKNQFVNYVVKYGVNVTKGAATMAYFDAANNILKLGFGDPNIKASDIISKAAHAFMDGVTGMSIMGAFGAYADVKKENNTSYKSFIYNMAVNHDAAADAFKLGLDNGEYTLAEYNQKMAILSTAKVAKVSADQAEQERDIKLNPEQKAVWVANKTAENFLRTKANDTQNEELKAKYEKQADQLSTQSKEIFQGLQFSSTLEPLTALHDAEKNYKEELGKFQSGETKDDTALVAAKEKHDELYKKYIVDGKLPSNDEKEEQEQIEKNRKADLSDIDDKINSLDEKSPTYEVDKSKLEKEKSETNDYYDNYKKEDTSQPKEDIKFPQRNDDFAFKYFNDAEKEKYSQLELDGKQDEITKMISDKKKEILSQSKPSNDEKEKTNAKEVVEPTKAEIDKGTGADNVSVPSIEKGLTVNGIKRSDAKKVYNEVNGMDEPTDARSAALNYISKGGKISEESINDVSGTAQRASLNTGKESKSNEVKAKDYSDKNAPSIKDAAHSIWDDLPEHLQNKISEQDIRNELEDVVKKHDKRLSAANEYLDKYHFENNLTAAEKAHYENTLPQEEDNLTKWLHSENDYEDEQHLPSDEFINQTIDDNEQSNKAADTKPSATGTEKSNKPVGETGNTIEDKGSENEKPIESEPPKPLELEGKTPNQQWTAIRKAKLQEVEAVKKLFDNPKRKKWKGVIESAMNNLQAMYPDKNLYDASRSRVNEFAALYDNGIPFNPTTEDLAVMQYFKAETEKRINEIQGWDSSDDITRLAATLEARALNDDLLAVGKSINTHEAGLAFGFRQSELRLDDDYGLQVRRMQLLSDKNGEKLTPEDLEFTSEQWDKEKELMQREQELKEKGMQESFDKQIDALKKSYEDRLKKAVKDIPKKEKTLKEKGEDVANKILKLKIKTDPNTLQSNILGLPIAVYNTLIDGIAGAVKGGATIADAIKEALKDDKYKGIKEDDLTKHILGGFDRDEKRTDALGKIKELSIASKVNGITSEMVGKNLIRDYVNSHIGEVEPQDVLKTALEGLKETLPDTTEAQLREAYLKDGEFKQPTKKALESDYKTSQTKLIKLAKIEKDLNDLKEKKNLYKPSTSDSTLRQTDKDIAAKEKELKTAMNDAGIKTSSEDKYTKASYESRAQSHNQRLDDIQNKIKEKIEGGKLTDEQKSALEKLNGQLESSKIKLDPDSKLSHKPVLDNGLSVLKKVKSEFDRTATKLSNVSELSGLKRDLQKSIDKFGTDKDESEQNIKLQRTKDKYQRDITETQRKINAGEYEDNPIVTLKKTDAELIKLERDRTYITQKYNSLKDKYKKENKSKFKKVAEFARAAEVAWLIGRVGTLVKVATSGFLRPTFEAATKLTGGKAFGALPFDTTKTIYEKAPLGGESTSLKSIKKSYQAQFAQYGDKGLEKLYTEANDRFEKSNTEYHKFKGEVDAMDKRTSEYKDAEKKLQKLDNTRKSDMIDAVGNSVYQYIAGSSIKEAMEVLLHRTAKIEQQFGQFDTEKFDTKHVASLDNIDYLINFIGRSHAAAKNFSGRAAFAAGFIARLEGNVKDGVDITKPDKIMEIANEAYNDWERGKYQEANYVSDSWNKITNAVEKVSPELAYIMKADVAITRVPVNMIYEGVAEYLLGAITGSLNAWKEYTKAKKSVLNLGITPKEGDEFKTALKEELAKITPERAADILRAFRKGGFGLGVYALAATGIIGFGGFSHKGQTAEDKKKKQRMADGGEEELMTGELKIGNYALPDDFSKIIEHTPALQPLLFGLGMHQVYKENIIAGESKPEAIINTAMAHVNHIANSIPIIDKFVLPVGKGAIDNIGISKFGQWTDIDQNGQPVKRQPLRASDYVKYISGKSNEELSEYYYRQALKTERYYNNQIGQVETDGTLTQSQKDEQRDSLLQQKESDIDSIYEDNKKNPQ